MKPGFLHIYLSSLHFMSKDEVPGEVFDIIGHLYVGFFLSNIDFLQFEPLPQD